MSTRRDPLRIAALRGALRKQYSNERTGRKRTRKNWCRPLTSIRGYTRSPSCVPGDRLFHSGLRNTQFPDPPPSEDLIAEHAVFAVLRDVDVRLWRVIFYTQIDEFRKQKRRVGQRGDPAQGDAIQRAFGRFLDESVAYFESLLERLFARRDSAGVRGAVAGRCGDPRTREGKPLSEDAALQRLCATALIH
eukprot:gene55026-biopygen68042